MSNIEQNCFMCQKFILCDCGNPHGDCQRNKDGNDPNDKYYELAAHQTGTNNNCDKFARRGDKNKWKL